jgi:ATP-dependent Clp protease protease subunit
MTTKALLLVILLQAIAKVSCFTPSVSGFGLNNGKGLWVPSRMARPLQPSPLVPITTSSSSPLSPSVSALPRTRSGWPIISPSSSSFSKYSPPSSSDDDDDDVVEDDPPPKPPPSPPMLPRVEGPHGSPPIDVMSRLLKDRILLLGTAVDDDVANLLVAQLLYLANDDPKKDITLYINSPGGSVSAGMAIYDTMQYVPCDVSTVCFGTAASMGAFLLGAGARGKRRSLPNARIMIHQPLGGAQGVAADVEIQAKEILFIRELLNTYISDYTGQTKKKIELDCDRDFFMTPEEAVEYGIIDEVVQTKTSHIKKPPMPEL